MKVYDSSGRLKIVQGIAGGGSTSPVIVANSRNLIIQSISTVQALLTADEVILKTAAGVSLLASGVSALFSINSGVGLNGFETGAVRGVSRWFYVWLISDSTNARVVLEDAGAGDGALPGGPDLSNAAFTGYSYMALVGQIRLNATGSGDIVPFTQADRVIWFDETLIFTGQLAAVDNTWEILAGANLTTFRSCVPPTAKSCMGNMGWIATSSPARIALAGCNNDGTVNTTNPVGIVFCVGQVLGTAWNGWTCASRFAVPVRGAAARNVEWKADRPDAIGRSRFSVVGYNF